MIITVAALTLSCSTGRNTSASRAYHELTTRYNIYHNAEQNYNRIIEDQITHSADNWFELLTFHPGEKNINKETPGGPFDAVIDIAAQSIVKHSITAKPRRDPTKAHSTEYRQWLNQEEFNPFIKSSWLLLGKAYVNNADYDEALSVFNEIQRIFPNEKELITETQIWMLRSYVGFNRMYDAANMVYILQTGTLPAHLSPLFNQDYTNYLLANKQYKEALPYLQKVIDSEKHYLQKKRLQFLKGQIYILLEDKDAAYESFEKIKGIRTPPEINNYASIYQAAITNGTKQKTHYSDSIAQIININLSHSNQNINISDSSNYYTISPIVRARTLELHSKKDTNLTLLTEDIKNSYNLLIFLEDSNNRLDQLLFATSNFNFSNYNLRTFKSTPIKLRSKQAVRVEPFISYSEAGRYFKQLKSDTTFRKQIPGILYPLIAEAVKIDSILFYGKKEDLEEASFIYPIKLSLTSEKVNREKVNPENAVAENEKKVKVLEEVKVELTIEAEAPKTPKIQPATTTEHPGLQPSEIKQRLELNEAEMLRRSKAAEREDNRKQLLKEREREREERIKNREIKIRERERNREAELRQREKEREQRIHEQQKSR